MHAIARAVNREALESDFDLAAQVREEVSKRLDEKGRLSLLPGSTSPWPDMHDCEEYLAARQHYDKASEALSEYCRHRKGGSQ